MTDEKGPKIPENPYGEQAFRLITGSTSWSDWVNAAIKFLKEKVGINRSAEDFKTDLEQSLEDIIDLETLEVRFIGFCQMQTFGLKEKQRKLLQTHEQQILNLLTQNLGPERAPVIETSEESKNLMEIAAVRGSISQLILGVTDLPDLVKAFFEKMKPRIPSNEGNASITRITVTDTDLFGKLFYVAKNLGIVPKEDDPNFKEQRRAFWDREIVKVLIGDKNYFYDLATGKFLLSGPPYPSFSK